jgi:predicted DNA-binding protein YlxM (UPF0122 family)
MKPDYVSGFFVLPGSRFFTLVYPPYFCGAALDKETYIGYTWCKAFCFTLDRGGRRMKAKDLRISLLLDFYRELLTDKQRDAVEMYYDADLSLAEIAEHTGTTRQGVRDTVKRAEAQLISLENSLGLATRFSEISRLAGEISEAARAIAEENRRIAASAAIDEHARRIVALAEEICS